MALRTLSVLLTLGTARALGSEIAHFFTRYRPELPYEALVARLPNTNGLKYGLRYLPTLSPHCDDALDQIELGHNCHPAGLEPCAATAASCPKPFVVVRRYDEFSEMNRLVMREALRVRPLRFVLEIGVNRNPLRRSSTGVILEHKPDTAFYLGLDLDAKSYLDDANKRVYTVKTDSARVEVVREFMRRHQLPHIDLLHIDGWHSLRQVLLEWEYVDMVAPGGVVVMHDVALHPGPRCVLDALDDRSWIRKERYWVPDDHGIALLQKK